MKDKEFKVTVIPMDTGIHGIKEFQATIYEITRKDNVVYEMYVSEFRARNSELAIDLANIYLRDRGLIPIE